jgi:hypothetical protein
VYDINEDIAYIIAIAQVYKDAKRLQESLDEFVNDFNAIRELATELETVKNIRLLFHRMILDQSEIAIHNIEIDYKNEHPS